MSLKNKTENESNITSNAESNLGKKKIIIKKQVGQKKDISEHFKVNKVAVVKEKEIPSRNPFAAEANLQAKQAGINQKPNREKANESPNKFPYQKNQNLNSQNEEQNIVTEQNTSKSENLAKTQGEKVNLVMQAAPPTAAQARGKIMRTGFGANARQNDKRFGDKQKEDRNFNDVQMLNKNKKINSAVVPSKIEITENIQVGELAKKMNLRPSELIGRLMRMGEMVTINKILDAETVSLIASEYNCEVKVVSLYEETVLKEEEDKEEDRKERPPVVTIMGHVDHGKTKLLDTIRSTNIIATEAGAITQHIGAYQVNTKHGKITFLDTPGHEAFSSMRARGASITDIVVLVVAADDGVKQQTIEAINHAKEAKVPIIVAVNKIDLPQSDVEKVKKELNQQNLTAESWGGDTVFCEVSAKEGTGIDHLLEIILLQAEMMKLTANYTLRAKGFVIEAKIDPGKGPVATVLIQNGVLREGDPYVVGVYSGRVRTMYNDLGKRIKEASPATPVEIAGIDGVPEAGDPFQVVHDEKYGRDVALKRQHFKQITNTAHRINPTLNELGSWVASHKELNIVIKADVQGSVEAIREGLLRLSTPDVKVRVIHGATGAIKDSDVNFASASNGIIIGFQVRATGKVTELAERLGVDIKYYSIIYNILNEVKLAMEGLLDPDKQEELLAKLEVRQIFKISKVGNIAGCKVVTGPIHRKNPVRVIRDNIVIYTGYIKALKRLKDDATEVAEGLECGVSIESFNDLKEGDFVESFRIKEIARKL